jgi:hypothetical protein
MNLLQKGDLSSYVNNKQLKIYTSGNNEIELEQQLIEIAMEPNQMDNICNGNFAKINKFTHRLNELMANSTKTARQSLAAVVCIHQLRKDLPSAVYLSVFGA